jgi:hypothetical protein
VSNLGPPTAGAAGRASQVDNLQAGEYNPASIRVLLLQAFPKNTTIRQ